MITYEEWRVTGRFINGFTGREEHYEYTWSPIRNPWQGDSETGARFFIRTMSDAEKWTDGPHLHKRTVTATDWAEEDA